MTITMRLFVLGFLVAGVVSAQTPAPIQTAEPVYVRVGSGNVMTFPARVTRVAVGDEKIVTIHMIEERQILVQGLAPGRSTFYIWMADGRRSRYDLVVSPRLETLESILRELDSSIRLESSSDGSTLILSGKVRDGRVAAEARRLAEEMMAASNNASRVVSLLQFPGSSEADLRLTSALASVDPRIRLRRMQVGTKSNNAVDAVVLEGTVKDVQSLVRAITLAELQLAGVVTKIEALDGEPFQGGRNRNFSGQGGGLQRLQGGDSPPSGIAAYVARGLVLKTVSGRVLSFLEVDELPQIMVSIRVLQVDRGRARRLGIDYSFTRDNIAVGSLHQPARTSLPPPPTTPSISGILGGNIVASFVDKTQAIVAAIEFLQLKDVARSVAEPNITTLSGESASVLVGGEVPIPTTTVGQATSVQGFLFQDFGVRLDIRPTLAPSGLVAMEISPSIIRPTADLAVSGVPGFQVQSVQTTAKVAPGQSLVIGGLISFEEELTKRGVPGLSDLPVMKHLFSWEGRTVKEQEILFVITPRVLDESPDQVAEAIPWRDVAPIPPGSVVELPSIDLDTARRPGPGTLGSDGLPPSFKPSPTPPSRRSDKRTRSTQAGAPARLFPTPQPNAASEKIVPPQLAAVPEKVVPPPQLAAAPEKIVAPPQTAAAPEKVVQAPRAAVPSKGVPRPQPTSAPDKNLQTPGPPANRDQSVQPPRRTVDLGSGMYASISGTDEIEVVVIPHKGDAWTRLAKRITGNAKSWREIATLNEAGENLTTEMRVRVPFRLLRPELQQQARKALTP